MGPRSLPGQMRPVESLLKVSGSLRDLPGDGHYGPSSSRPQRGRGAGYGGLGFCTMTECGEGKQLGRAPPLALAAASSMPD